MTQKHPVSANSEVIGAFVLVRQAHVVNGVAMQELSLLRDGKVLHSWDWALDSQGSHDGQLRVMRHHWKHFVDEIKDTHEKAQLYRRIKLGGKEEGDGFVQAIVDHFTRYAMMPNMTEEERRAGIVQKRYYPNASVSDRMRHMWQEMGKADKCFMPDRFEKLLQSVDRRMGKMWRLHDDPHYGGISGFQDTAGEFEFENEDAWRGDVHAKEPKGFVPDAPSWTPEYRGGEPESPLRKMLYDYSALQSRFTNAAVRVWMAAAGQIDTHEAVTVNEPELNVMRECVSKMLAMHDALRKEIKGSGMAFEMRSLIALLDHPEKHVESRMQLAIAMASRPARFEEEIRKGMPRGYDLH